MQKVNCNICGNTRRTIVYTPHGEKERNCSCLYEKKEKKKKCKLSAYEMADKLGLMCI